MIKRGVRSRSVQRILLSLFHLGACADSDLAHQLLFSTKKPYDFPVIPPVVLTPFTVRLG